MRSPCLLFSHLPYFSEISPAVTTKQAKNTNKQTNKKVLDGRKLKTANACGASIIMSVLCIAHKALPTPRQFQQRLSTEVQLAQEARLLTLVFVPYLHRQFNIRALLLPRSFISPIPRCYGAAGFVAVPLAVFVRPTSAFFFEPVGLFRC